MSMDCDFCMDMDVSGCEFSDYIVLIQIAPAAFKCYECQREFQAGIEQEYLTATDQNGASFTADTCMDCHHVAEGLICGNRSHGSLWDGIEAMLDEGETFTTACLAKVETASAKGYLVAFINKLNGVA